MHSIEEKREEARPHLLDVIESTFSTGSNDPKLSGTCNVEPVKTLRFHLFNQVVIY
jgi:hypothetical protein